MSIRWAVRRIAADAAWEDIRVAPAVALFLQQARAVRPSFALTAANAGTVAEICRRLDGLPLAIELAAARTRVLSPEAVLAQLRQRPLHLLRGGARDTPERHRTLREAIAWSYGLLEPSQQTLFRRMSVFLGGCTLEAVQAVLDDEATVAAGLESLLDKHLLASAELDDEASEDVRYRQLEMIREFGVELLEASGEADVARERHARYLVTLVERAAPGLYGAQQQVWIERLLREHNNIRAALDWSAASSSDGQARTLGLRLAGSLWLFWRVRGFVTEGRARLATLLAAEGVTFDADSAELSAGSASVVVARALYAAGYLAFAQAAADDANSLLSASLEMGRAVGDLWSQSYALHGLGHAALLRGDFPRARRLYTERLSMAREQHDDYALGQTLNALGEVARCVDEPDQARPFYEQSLAIRRRLGDTRGVAMGLCNLGHVAVAAGDSAAARRAFDEGVRLMEQLGHQYGQAVCVSGLAAVAMAEGRAPAAARLLGATVAALEHVGDSLEPPDMLAHERTLGAAQAALGAAFESEFRVGRALRLADAVALGQADAVVAEPSKDGPAAMAGAFADADLLSPREQEVAILIARGCTSQAIAAALVITARTADTHAAHIRDKLGLRSRAEIAAWAIRHGLT